jgi:hypothetical protein
MPPTIAEKDLPEADYLPPAAQGDVYRIAEQRPHAIAIIDGHFQQTAAVWHKEILWAMVEGVHVFGAASMGALRAAELHMFGMRGVGRIFELYRDGKLTDDDEVAVLHGPPETNYVSVSDSMVNVRATLHAAADARVISDRTANRLELAGKKLFYQNRTYDNILATADIPDLPKDEIAALKRWLPENRVDIKREDALRLLRNLRLFMADWPGPMEVEWSLENTPRRRLWA